MNYCSSPSPNVASFEAVDADDLRDSKRRLANAVPVGTWDKMKPRLKGFQKEVGQKNLQMDNAEIEDAIARQSEVEESLTDKMGQNEEQLEACDSKKRETEELISLTRKKLEVVQGRMEELQQTLAITNKIRAYNASTVDEIKQSLLDSKKQTKLLQCIRFNQPTSTLFDACHPFAIQQVLCDDKDGFFSEKFFKMNGFELNLAARVVVLCGYEENPAFTEIIHTTAFKIKYGEMRSFNIYTKNNGEQTLPRLKEKFAVMLGLPMEERQLHIFKTFLLGRIASPMASQDLLIENKEVSPAAGLSESSLGFKRGRSPGLGSTTFTLPHFDGRESLQDREESIEQAKAKLAEQQLAIEEAELEIQREISAPSTKKRRVSYSSNVAHSPFGNRDA